MTKPILFGMTLAVLSLSGPIQAGEVPQWAHEEMEILVGRWVADNSAYRNDAEPYDAYGMEWKWGAGRKSLTGQLFALRDGAELGTFWEFRIFWHPGEAQLMVYQFGSDGAVCHGHLERTGDGTSELVQLFYGPGGNATRIAHRTRVEGDVRHDGSYLVDDDGEWQLLRTYEWRCAPENQNG
jgi:hypothetical protein